TGPPSITRVSAVEGMPEFAALAPGGKEEGAVVLDDEVVGERIHGEACLAEHRPGPFPRGADIYPEGSPEEEGPLRAFQDASEASVEARKILGIFHASVERIEGAFRIPDVELIL